MAALKPGRAGQARRAVGHFHGYQAVAALKHDDGPLDLAPPPDFHGYQAVAALKPDQRLVEARLEGVGISTAIRLWPH